MGVGSALCRARLATRVGPQHPQPAGPVLPVPLVAGGQDGRPCSQGGRQGVGSVCRVGALLRTARLLGRQPWRRQQRQLCMGPAGTGAATWRLLLRSTHLHLHLPATGRRARA